MDGIIGNLCFFVVFIGELDFVVGGGVWEEVVVDFLGVSVYLFVVFGFGGERVVYDVMVDIIVSGNGGYESVVDSLYSRF